MHNASLKRISLQVHYMQQPDKTGSKLDFVHCQIAIFHVAIQCSQACSSHTVCTKLWNLPWQTRFNWLREKRSGYTMLSVYYNDVHNEQCCKFRELNGV